jgi:hypothetical protein
MLHGMVTPSTDSPSGSHDAPLSPAMPLPAILDVEASGFGRDSYPIEIGYVLPDGTSFCTLIRPASHWTHWDTAAEYVHHIRRESLAQHGRSIDDVAQLLNERLRGMTLYSDGWANDYPWLAALFEEADCVPHFRLDSLRGLLSDDEARAWHTTKQSVSREMSLPRHRASADARLLQLTLRRLREGNAVSLG